jgi:hypothetical protein
MHPAKPISLLTSRIALLVLLVLCLPVARPALAQNIDLVGSGVTNSTWPTVANIETGTGTCSATLIGCNTLLTAAHCLCEPGGTGDPCPDGTNLLDPNNYSVFIPHGGEFFVTDVEIAPGFEFGVASDLALLTLDFPLRGLAPEKINTAARPGFGTVATAVGFGTRSEFDSLIKREGDITTSSCVNSGTPDATHLCWEDPAAQTCSGDSGGPLFADVGAGLTLAGVHSGGSPICLPGDPAFNADVFVDRDWITSTGGADLGFDACGDGAQIGDAAVIEENIAETVDVSASYSFGVPPTTKLLRVALNGAIGMNADNDLDLYVRFGAPASPTAFDCGPQLFGTLEMCEIPDPTPGTWFTNVDVFAGDEMAEYQLTIVQLPQNPPPPSVNPGDYLLTDFRAWEVMHIDESSGDRAILSSTLSGTGSELVAPEGVSLSPNGAEIIVANLGQLAVLSIDPDTGDRTVMSGCTDLDFNGSCAGSVIGAGLDFLGPRFLAFENGADPDLVVSDRSDPGVAAIVRVDPVTGDRSIISGCTNSNCGSTTGAGPALDTPFGIGVEDDGDIIVGESYGLLRVDPVTGDRVSISGCNDLSCTSTIGSGPLFTRSGELEIAPSGDIVIVDGIRSVLRVDPTTGNRTVVSGCSDAACTATVGGGPDFTDQLFGLEVLYSGDLIAVDSGLRAILHVDGTTGDRTIISGCADAACSTLVGTGTAFSDPVGIVPEPAGTVGLLAGGGLLAALHRRRRRPVVAESEDR